MPVFDFPYDETVIKTEVDSDLRDWELLRQDLGRMSGAGIRSGLMQKKERSFTSGNSKTIVESSWGVLRPLPSFS